MNIVSRFEASSSACTNTCNIYSKAWYAGNHVSQYGTGIPMDAVLRLHIIIYQFRTRASPTARRLARIHAMLECFRSPSLSCMRWGCAAIYGSCACGGDAHVLSATVVILG
jgi:hypothetical protein